jgi:uncharacterized membrane protein YdbT with pleckstrin-like domain
MSRPFLNPESGSSTERICIGLSIGAVVLLLIGSGLLLYSAREALELGEGIGLVLIALAALSFMSAGIDCWTTEIAVTDERVIMKRGLIRRDTIEINMPKVEGVDVHQSILGRLLNYGTVTVRGTGGGLNPLAYVSAPLPLRRAVNLQSKTSSSSSPDRLRSVRNTKNGMGWRA